MTKHTWESVWERVRLGKHTLVIGPGMLPAAPHDLQVLHVSCDAPGNSGGAIVAARRHIEHFLGEELPFPAIPEAGESGLRQRFLGDLPGPSLDALLVEACNRLASQSGRGAVLAFEAVDAADVATLETLTQILKSPGWLRLPLLLTVRGTPQGLVTGLVYLLCREGDDAAVLEIDDVALPGEPVSPFDWTALPPEVLRVLRAGAVLGSTFEAELVARLLDEPLGVVLEKLQWATDAGAPLADRGEGRFTLPADTIALLHSRILPSLLTFWHARLGELLSGRRPVQEISGAAQHSEGMPSRATRTAPGERLAGPAQETITGAQRGNEPALPPSPPLTDYGAMFEPAQRSAVSETAPPAWAFQDEPTVAPHRMADRPASPGRPTVDQTRAASHLQAAGQTEAAVERYLAAVHEATAYGDARRAYSLVEQALQLLDEIPTSNRRALLRTQLWIEKGRLQWHGALLGSPFSLQGALASLETAESVLPPEAPAEVVGYLATVTAGVCYDLGTLEALQRALEILTVSSRRLLSASEPLLAARLLNDQAAVSIRLGDPVRATYLLSQSRELFERRQHTNPNDTMASEELAETNHLLARLPLHAQLRPGREQEASTLALEHARAAEKTYERLGQPQPRARVLETMGRLELQRGQLQAAQEYLSAAFAQQRQIGDIIGLARSTAALGELCVRTGRLDEAVALLSESVTLNFEKGSPLGLAFNRRALDALVHATTQGHGPDTEKFRAALQEVEERLAHAEVVLGRLGLPGESDRRSFSTAAVASMTRR